MNQKES